MMNNDKVDWRRKLSSRKFWVALIGFITPLLYMFNVSSSNVENVTSLIMAGASLIAYIFAEGFIDAKEVESYKVSESYNLSEHYNGE